ncbi:energy transducer TonB [Paludibacterium purpuratum]|uniref:Outer membrane transport energization protein TonB n=1 Tax=Paludibacterium purpuratum TaxID=1144873 RepID=A0A4R7AVY1_9NEIS|nr:energy transducer TonB [Paludibacterium purpuratum]TDR71425.1 outer membrane transport energization protein TonB [Paludibacterium purpuratum]
MSVLKLVPPNADQRRDAVAAVAAAAAMLGLYAVGHLSPMPRFHHEKPPVVLQVLPVPPEPVATPLQPPRPRPVLAKSQPQSHATPSPTPMPTPAPSARPLAAAPVSATPMPSAPAKAEATPAPVAPPAPRVNVSADREFEARIRALIEQQKTYPTGRQAAIEKPAGIVHACVDISRDGAVRSVSIQESAGAGLLDQAAKRLMNTLSYPAFPEAVYAGAASHVFCTRLKYEPPSN